MAIVGIEGGIGSGKTLLLTWFAMTDLKNGKTLFSNIKFNNIKGNVQYLDVEMINTMFEKIKNKEFNMNNASVYIQEAHNYVDSRNAMSKKNKTFTYWILQSRHTGKGSNDVLYDTQDFGQVDIRLRRNTDYFLRPYIIEWQIDKKNKTRKPKKIMVMGNAKIGHKISKFSFTADVLKCCDVYDTHELVYF